MIVDRAIYRDGLRTAEELGPAGLGEARETGVDWAWVALDRPTEQEFATVADQFGLYRAAVEHTLELHQRPRLEHYGATLFCVLRTAHYVDESETVEFGEVHVFMSSGFVVTVRHGVTPDMAAVRQALEARPERLRRGPVAVLRAVMDQVMDD